jgi:DNA-binding CsgD family transcriptional regulator
MNETLAMLKPYIREELCKLSYDELAIMYQTNPSDDIVASVFNKVYLMALQISSNYWSIDKDDLSSYCLECIVKCLKNYDSEHYKNAFTSMFHKYYTSCLRNITVAANYKKRKCIMESLDEIYDFGTEDDYYLIPEILPKNLTKNERAVCEMLSKGFDSFSIINCLDITAGGLSYLKKSIRIKLSTLQSAPV